MRLDAKINEVGFDLANLLDKNTIEKLLGVLSADGVYAMWVYAKDKLNFDFNQDFINKELFKFLKQMSEFQNYFKKLYLWNDEKKSKIENLSKEITKKYNKLNSLKNNQRKERDQLFKQISQQKEERLKLIDKPFLKLSENLEQLLFFKEILEKTLIYARYHAKAKGEE